MKAYLDSEDSYYRYNEESVKEELINVKVNRDYASLCSIIFGFTVISIVIGLSYIQRGKWHTDILTLKNIKIILTYTKKY